MLNLFLAILLGNFDRARAKGGKKTIFAAFESFKNQGYDLTIAIEYLFDDIQFSAYIQEKILSVTDPRDLERERKRAIEAGELVEDSKDEQSQGS